MEAILQEEAGMKNLFGHITGHSGNKICCVQLPLTSSAELIRWNGTRTIGADKGLC